MIKEFKFIVFISFGSVLGHGMITSLVEKASSRRFLMSIYLVSPNSVPSNSQKMSMISISKEEDLKGKSLSEIWKYIEEISGKIQTTGALQSDNKKNVYSHTLTKNTESFLKTYWLKYDARGFGGRAHSRARFAVFPGCISEQILKWNLTTLINVINNPEEALEKGLCSSKSYNRWLNEKTEAERNEIKFKSQILLQKFPKLLSSIQLLYDCPQEYDFNEYMTIEDNISFYTEIDIEVANALKHIQPIVKLDDMFLEDLVDPNVPIEMFRIVS